MLGPGAGWGFSEVAVMVVVVMVVSLVVVSVIFPAASNPSLDDPAPSHLPAIIFVRLLCLSLFARCCPFVVGRVSLVVC